MVLIYIKAKVAKSTLKMAEEMQTHQYNSLSIFSQFYQLHHSADVHSNSQNSQKNR